MYSYAILVANKGSPMYERVKILQPILDAAVKAKERVWPTHTGASLDRTKYVSASEIGQCARRIWFSKNLPLTESSFYWGYSERGHASEAWIVDKLRSFEHDYRWTYIGKDQVSFHADYQSGTPDGLLDTGEMLLVVDFKSVDPRLSIKKLPKKEHLDQIIQNMDLIEHCLDISVSGALLAYSDASDYAKINEWMVNRNSPQVGERMVELELRAETIMQATSAEQLEPEGMYNGSCNQCPFKAECSGAIQLERERVEHYGKAKQASSRIFG